MGEREREREREGEVSVDPMQPCRWAAAARMHLANVVRADCGDGLESQLLAADAHEDLLHLAQEILSYICGQKQKQL